MQAAVSRAEPAWSSFNAGEHLYRRLVETSPDGVTIVDLTGRIVMANDRFADLLDFSSADDLVGLSSFDLIAPEDRDRANTRVSATLDRGTVHEVRYQLLRRNGTTFPAEIHSSVVHGDHGCPIGFISVVRDVTRYVEVIRALEYSEARYRELFENANDMVFTVDLAGNFTSANKAAARISGYTAEEIVGLNIAQILPPEHLELARHMILEKLHNNAATTYELEFVAHGGRRVPIELSTTLILQDGMPVGVQGIARDVTDRKSLERQLRHQALHDALTGLPNRLLLHDRLEQGILLARRDRTSLALLLMDLDRFKEVNDTFGHHCGDALLQQMAERLRGCLRASDTIARLGGDEFAVILPGLDGAGAGCTAARLQRALDRPYVVEGQPLHVAASIGIALFPQHGEDGPGLLRQADVAMYLAKQQRACHALYDPRTDPHSPTRLTLTTDLRHAIEHGGLVLHYQPKLDLAGKEVREVEALVRWEHPERGLMSPADFIPLAEDTGLIEPLTLWVVRTALTQCRSWRQEGLAIRVAVNLSARCIHSPEIQRGIIEALNDLEMPGSALEIEITESALMVDPERALQVLADLHGRGVKISIDDFGTGYSSLGYLKKLPVDEIKIDRSFVMNMVDNSGHAAIVRSIVSLGHELGMQVVAEGVESRQILDLLASVHCDYAQGFYISRPVSPDALHTWFAQQ